MSLTSDSWQVFLRVQGAVERLKQLNIFKDGMEVSLAKAKGRPLLVSHASPYLHHCCIAQYSNGEGGGWCMRLGVRTVQVECLVRYVIVGSEVEWKWELEYRPTVAQSHIRIHTICMSNRHTIVHTPHSHNINV